MKDMINIYILKGNKESPNLPISKMMTPNIYPGLLTTQASAGWQQSRWHDERRQLHDT